MIPSTLRTKRQVSRKCICNGRCWLGQGRVRLGLRATRDLQRGVWDQETWAQLLVFSVETGVGWSGSTAWAMPQVGCGERGDQSSRMDQVCGSSQHARPFPVQAKHPPCLQPSLVLLSQRTKSGSFSCPQGTRLCIRLLCKYTPRQDNSCVVKQHLSYT